VKFAFLDGFIDDLNLETYETYDFVRSFLYFDVKLSITFLLLIMVVWYNLSL